MEPQRRVSRRSRRRRDRCPAVRRCLHHASAISKCLANQHDLELLIEPERFPLELLQTWNSWRGSVLKMSKLDRPVLESALNSFVILRLGRQTGTCGNHDGQLTTYH